MRARSVGFAIFVMIVFSAGMAELMIYSVVSPDESINRVNNLSDRQLSTTIDLEFSERGKQYITFVVPRHSREERKIEIIDDGMVAVYVHDGVGESEVHDYLTHGVKVGVLYVPSYELIYNGASLSGEWHSVLDWLGGIYSYYEDS
ncbi:hypothetical protein SAZ10_00555 [Mesorhizobium sp. BAC0120]|uniref:hypothetical protein n=1 Tax=Mesorhizobium sp. BAC0120 TaxID=3090670 RepID=UPI00298BCABD|nr:hypothetical protein [Mesorhizobium sp. BAC0120]MDW6020246.1 hypothetical protein [Mesorhizobium sp. BAC0120]